MEAVGALAGAAEARAAPRERGGEDICDTRPSYGPHIHYRRRGFAALSTTTDAFIIVDAAMIIVGAAALPPLVGLVFGTPHVAKKGNLPRIAGRNALQRRGK